MFRSLALVALLGASASAAYHGNLNYRSPSSAHPALGIDVVKVVNRNLVKRDDTGYDPASLQFTHSVASVRTPVHPQNNHLPCRAIRMPTLSFYGPELHLRSKAIPPTSLSRAMSLSTATRPSDISRIHPARSALIGWSLQTRLSQVSSLLDKHTPLPISTIQ
jgi:hypothetical protein